VSQHRGGDGLPLLVKGAMLHAQLADRFPGVPVHRQDLLIDCLNVAPLLEQAGQDPQARQVYALGRQAGEYLVTQFPAVADYQSDLAALLQNQAGALLHRGELAEAGRLLEQAAARQQAALARDRGRAEYCSRLRMHLATLAEVRRRLGDPAGLAEVARTWHRAFPDNGQDGYAAACCLARSAGLAARDQTRPETERTEAARKYADEAVGLLRHAISAGFADQERLGQDPALNVLRAREDFRQLQARLGAGPRTEKP
jgi:hypothetical protein